MAVTVPRRPDAPDARTVPAGTDLARHPVTMPLKVKFSGAAALVHCAGRVGQHISADMRWILCLIAVLSLGAAPPTQAWAADNEVETDAERPVVLDAAETSLSDWLWIKRPVVVFADNAADPRFQEQIELLTERYSALEERDVVIIVDSDPEAMTSVRKALRPRGFMLVVMAKDGTIVTRKPGPWSVREISRSIDKLPLRQDELKGF